MPHACRYYAIASHSLIVGPWGEVLADGGAEVGVVSADLDLDLVDAARRKIPALTHDRLVEIDLVAASAGDLERSSSHPSAS
jgi:predicted amidohydrolase